MGSVCIPEEGNGTVRPLRVDPSRCSRMRYSGSRCERCVAACPRSAIRLDEWLDVREERCTGCLTCTTVCPSGALEAEADFDRLIRGLASHPFPTLVVGCGKSGSPSHRHLPCLGMLSAEHLVALSARGEAIVQLDASACNGCDAGGMHQHLTARLRKTEEESGLPLGIRIRLIPDAQELDFRPESLDRRGFFRSFRRLAFQGMTTVLASPSTERKVMLYMDKYLPARRAILLAALASLPPETAQGVRNALSFSIAFGTSCDGCLGCVRACPSAALSDSGISGSPPPCPGSIPKGAQGAGSAPNSACPRPSVWIQPADRQTVGESPLKKKIRGGKNVFQEEKRIGSRYP